MDLDAPGLERKPNKDGMRLYWRATKRARELGYAPSMVRLIGETDEEVASECRILQAEMLEWVSQKEGAADYVAANPTLSALFRQYRLRPESPFARVKWNTAQKDYSWRLDALEAAAGDVRVSQVNLSFLRRLYEDASDGGAHITKAHKLMGMLRRVFSFGVAAEIEGCDRVAAILANTTFEAPARRAVAMSADQALCFVDVAKGNARSSLALGTALQFECGMRQKDVIGEWEPIPAGGPTSNWVMNGRQWANGLTWSHIDDNWRLTKRTTKTGSVISHDLTLCPMAFELLEAVPESQRVGPIIIDEKAGRPYANNRYQEEWRVVANAAGLPKDLRNMDARAGAATEADEAGAALDDIRPTLGHSDSRTTARYVRGQSLEQSRRVAELRLAHRRKNGG
jgi:integrase